MPRKPEQTRGRRPKVDKAYLHTTGDFELDKGAVVKLFEPIVGKLTAQQESSITQLLNSRITEVRNRYLTWAEAEEAVAIFLDAARKASDAITEVSELGENSVSRPLGTHLLESLDYDFNEPNAYLRLDWVSVKAWLDKSIESIPNEFTPHKGGAAPYDEFIMQMADIAESKGGSLNHLLATLESELPGLVFPSHCTQPHARGDYVKNVLRRNRK